MKQILSLALALIPCLAWAQYPSNGNQKITLGEQTTADGLIYRGVASTDTVRKPSIDTMAYMVLDTTTNIIWHYKKATSNAWLRLNLLPSDTASMLTNYWRSGRFSGTLPVANGGTNTTTLTGNKVMVGNGTNGVLTPTNLHWDNENSRLGIGIPNPALTLTVISSSSNDGISTYNTATNGAADIRIGNNTYNNLGFLRVGGSSYGTSANQNTLMVGTGGGFTIHIAPNSNPAITALNGGNVGIGTISPQTKLHIAQSSSAVLFSESSGTATIIGTNAAGTASQELSLRGFPLTFTGDGGGGSEHMRITSAGEVNIGYGATDNGAYKLQVNSQIFATNSTIATSDIRFKENIQPLDKGLEIINKLKPVKFNFISTTENNFSEFDEIGFIAQDVEGALSTELFAKAVVKKLDEDKDDSALGLMTEKFIPILVKAIQEQQALIKALEQRIINLENK